MRGLHDCFTQSSFWKRFRRLLLLLLPSLLRLVRLGRTSLPEPFPPLSYAPRRRGGEVAVRASSGARWDGSARCDLRLAGTVDERINGGKGVSKSEAMAILWRPEGGAMD
jgi:hypothetical protein